MPETLRVAIIGGGAAGFFAAIAAKRKQPQAEITIFEKSRKVLAKVEVTGGGRCNLTNSFEEITDLKHAYPRGHQLMKRLLRCFDHRRAYEWFERNGVPLVVQDDQCVFPASQDSHSVIDCLVAAARQLGVRVRTGHRLVSIGKGADTQLTLGFHVTQGSGAPDGEHRQMSFDRVAITTGGHPQARHFSALASLGHKIEPPVPSLFTLTIADKALRGMMGTVVEHAATSIVGTKLRASGPLLVTHWGMSGPAILKLSSYGARYLSENQYKTRIAVDWTGAGGRQRVEECLQGIAGKNPQKQLASVRPFGLPSRLWMYLVAKAGLPAGRKWGEMGKKSANVLIETLTNDTYQVEGRGAFKEEFVTCGGVSVSGVNLNTLESKVCPHLFFAGEVLDVDAITGGFNLQAAWTTGYVVGQHIVE